MKLSFINIATVLLSLMFVCRISAQNREREVLKNMGMENIQVLVDKGDTYVSYQDDIYRGIPLGISEVVKALREVDSLSTLHMVLLEHEQPRLAVTVPADTTQKMSFSYNTSDYSARLKGTRTSNRSFGRLDITLYPQLFLENWWFDKLYGVAVSISPAAELTLWRGAKATAQVVIPLYTNLIDEKEYVRPGVITLSQNIRFCDRFFGDLAVGNFTDDRMGVDARVNYYTSDGNWNFGARVGTTVASTFYGGEWEINEILRVYGGGFELGSSVQTSWSTWASYYYPKYDLAIKGEVLQMIYGDRGVRGTLQRYFRNVSVGLYVMNTGSETNGGFFYSFALPGKRRPRRNCGVRVSYPEYFTRVYKARSGIETLTGFGYETSPTAGSLGDFDNLYYLEKYTTK